MFKKFKLYILKRTFWIIQFQLVLWSYKKRAFLFHLLALCCKIRPVYGERKC